MSGLLVYPASGCLIGRKCRPPHAMRPDSAFIPHDKFDLVAANAAAGADWSQIEQVAEQLLQWVQDVNWPVARVLAPFLAGIGAPLAPHIRRVLAGDDEVWKYSLIGSVVAHSQDLVLALRSELERIAYEPTPSERAEEVSNIAREALGQQ